MRRFDTDWCHLRYQQGAVHNSDSSDTFAENTRGRNHACAIETVRTKTLRNVMMNSGYHQLPQVCIKCRKLKLRSLGRLFRGSRYHQWQFICHECDKQSNRGRRQTKKKN